MSTRRSSRPFLFPLVFLAACQASDLPTAAHQTEPGPALSARPAAPTMSWSPVEPDGFTYDFGFVPVGESRTQVLTLSAAGGTVRGLALRFEGFPGEDGELTVLGNTCGRQLKVGQPCEVTIQFRPVLVFYSEARIYVDSKNAGIRDLRITGIGDPPTE
jgi:hypothetical protein